MPKKTKKKKLIEWIKTKADLSWENPLDIGAMPDNTVTKENVDEAQNKLSDDYKKDRQK